MAVSTLESNGMISGSGGGFAQLLRGFHHRLRAPRQAIHAPHPSALLPRFVFIEGRIDAAQHRIQRNAGLAPRLDQRPIERGEQQQRTASPLKALLDLGKVIEIVAHFSASMRFAARFDRAVALKEDQQAVQGEHIVDLGDIARVLGDLPRQTARGNDPRLLAQFRHDALQDSVH